jgi:hypothetical protein
MATEQLVVPANLEIDQCLERSACMPWLLITLSVSKANVTGTVYLDLLPDQ